MRLISPTTRAGTDSPDFISPVQNPLGFFALRKQHSLWTSDSESNHAEGADIDHAEGAEIDDDVS